MAGTDYVALCHPSGGSQNAMALAIAHHADGRAVLDAVREVRPLFSSRRSLPSSRHWSGSMASRRSAATGTLASGRVTDSARTASRTSRRAR